MFDKKLPQKWDEAADIVIVGSGFAGLAAAIEARQTGSSVIILERWAMAVILRSAMVLLPLLLRKFKQIQQLQILLSSCMTTCSKPVLDLTNPI